MSIYHIPTNINLKDFSTFDITDDILKSFETINDYDKVIKKRLEYHYYLQELKINEILEYFNSIAIYWLTDRKSTFLEDFSNIGVSFLINFLKKTNLESLIKGALHGDIEVLDNFIFNKT